MAKVYTGGTFDLFHAGHVNFLRQCKRIAGDDALVVSLNSDEFIKRYKGSPPLASFKERQAVLEACRYVDRVIENWGDEDSKVAIEFVKPAVVAIGTDWASKNYHHQMGFTQEWLDDRAIVLAYLPYTNGISTTELKKRIVNGS